MSDPISQPLSLPVFIDIFGCELTRLGEEMVRCMIHYRATEDFTKSWVAGKPLGAP